jgi:hypothetical protein
MLQVIEITNNWHRPGVAGEEPCSICLLRVWISCAGSAVWPSPGCRTLSCHTSAARGCGCDPQTASRRSRPRTHALLALPPKSAGQPRISQFSTAAHRAPALAPTASENRRWRAEDACAAPQLARAGQAGADRLRAGGGRPQGPRIFDRLPRAVQLHGAARGELRPGSARLPAPVASARDLKTCWSAPQRRVDHYMSADDRQSAAANGDDLRC